MSLVYITYHDENIFDVDKVKIMPASRKRLKYTSKFRKMIRDERNARHVIEMPEHKKILTSSAKNCHQTMGYALTPVNKPCNFLKKHQGVKWQRLNEHKCPPKVKIPPVPHFTHAPASASASAKRGEIAKEVRREEDQTMCPGTRFFKGHKHRANFVALNVELMKKRETIRPPPCYVDTPKGDRHALVSSGLVPEHICSKKFGKVPCYLDGRKKMLKKLNERCAEAKAEVQDPCMYGYMKSMEGLKKLSAEERNDILKGLRTNFASVFKVYQSLSVCTDTIAKQMKKGKLENELRQLEQDIYLMEHNPDIYISAY